MPKNQWQREKYLDEFVWTQLKKSIITEFSSEAMLAKRQ